MSEGDGRGGFDSARAELFEALGHPNRIRILQAMREGPLGFAELKRQVGIESSGHLTFHLGKLGGLVSWGQMGVTC
ncbi:MAG: winged helix-turn-helix domain-containing protein [Thaumarchaeota archaeon]|nr:winged helix-turn-helix domain-containing protein [Nitrososphaerota archaeon]